MAQIIGNMEYLGRLMVRCVAYEELYLVPKSKPRNYPTLKLSVEELYREILEFLMETTKHLHRETIGIPRIPIFYHMLQSHSENVRDA